MLRSRAGRKRSDATRYQLAQSGLQIYDPNELGMRNEEDDDRTGPHHEQKSMPPIPFLADNVMWMFRKSSDVSSDSWDITEVGSGSQLALQDQLGGTAKFTLGSADNNYQTYFSKSGHLQIPANGVVTVKFGLRILDPDQCDMFFGFCETLASGNLFDNRVNAVGIYLEDGSASLAAESRSGGSANSDTGIYTIREDVWEYFVFGIHCKNSESRKAVSIFTHEAPTPSGHELAYFTSTIPTAAMKLAFGLRNGQASANAMTICSINMVVDRNIE